MTGILIISHYTLAQSIKDTVSVIIGEKDNVKTLSINKNDKMEDFSDKLKKEVETLNSGDGVLILADMFGGTPCNVSLSLFGNSADVGIITGVNLPLVIEAVMHSSKKIDELVKLLVEKKDKTIIDAKHIFMNKGN